jgi:hypothetical protein
MNVLILTPDRVGSTLLQRLLTIYMINKGFDKPIINLHELTNGLVKYYNTQLNQDVLGKPEGVDWGYFQSLPEIIELLSTVSHFKTSRLAHYHLINRNDNLNDQLKFYEYLNNNFYIISCRRENLLEHGLSWAIQAHSKKLNVYSPQEKISNFEKIYNKGITVNRIGFEKYLNNYVKYINWSNTHFNIQSYFDYDVHMNNIESYILNLDFMQDCADNTWNNMFGQVFEDWNACHRLIPNLFLRDHVNIKDPKKLTVHTNNINEQNWEQIRGPDWPRSWAEVGSPGLPAEIQDEIESQLHLHSAKVTDNEYNFLSNNLPAYKNAITQIEKLKDDGFLVTGVPLKLQSLQEKKHVIKNFSECVNWYNQWVDNNNFGKHYSDVELDQLAHNEELRLTGPIHQLLYSSCKPLGS